MVIKYTFEFTDTSKDSFDVFPYTANGTVSPTDSNFIDQAVSAKTTLKLYGKGMPDYGEGIEQNLIYMLENFANITAPLNSIEGQLWYNTVGTGSPVLGPELSIYNNTGWDAIVLATGTSPMTGELILAGDPSNALGATPKQYVDAHIADFVLHLTPDQNAFLDGLSLSGSPLLTSADVNQLTGISGNVQSLLDLKLSLDGSLSMTGELILAGDPSNALGATSKQYVDDLVLSGNNDSALSIVDWIIPTGSPLPIADINATTLQFTISTQGSPQIPIGILTATGISREGHFHDASEIIVDNTFNPVYSTNLQSVVEDLDANKASLLGDTFTGPVNMANLNVSGTGTFINPVSGVDPISGTDLATKNYVDNKTITVTRTFEARIIDLLSGIPYLVQNHLVNDNKLSITVNGVKQYVDAHGYQQVQYDIDAPILQAGALTGIDQTLTHDFNISIDGAAPITITIPPALGSPAGPDISTQGNLVSVINSIMSAGSPPLADAVFSIDGPATQQFIANSSGSTSTITISDPASVNTYLFATDTGTAIVGVNFKYWQGSPDEIIIAGDVTSILPAGTAFAIRNSDELTFGGYNGVYQVYGTGPVFSASPGITTIPVASLTNSFTITPLIAGYFGGSPAPSPSPFGSIYITPIVGFDSVLPAITGIDGDYTETDSLGNAIAPGNFSSYVTFNYNILAGGSPVIPNNIETLLIS